MPADFAFKTYSGAPNFNKEKKSTPTIFNRCKDARTSENITIFKCWNTFEDEVPKIPKMVKF